MAEQSRTDEQEVNEAGSVAELWKQLGVDPQLSGAILNRLRIGRSGAGAGSGHLEGDFRIRSGDVSSYNDVQQFLEEGRQLKWIASELTETVLLESYDQQRRWFTCLVIVSGILGLLILVLEGLLFFFDWKHSSRESLSLSGIKSLHSHSIAMTLSVVIGFPLSVLPYRCCPNTRIWTLNYVHAALYTAVALLFIAGLLVMVIGHSQFDMVHLGTFHSWMGLLLTVGLAVEMISGFLFFRRKYRKDVRSSTDFKVQFHTFLGECILVLGLVTWVSGISHAHNFQNAAWWHGFTWNVIGLLSFLLTMISFVLIFHPVFRRRSKPLTECIYANQLPIQGSSRTIVSKRELLGGVKDKIQIPPRRVAREVTSDTDT